MEYIRLLRVRHWIKNLFLFAAPFFGGTLFNENTLLIAFPAFFAFSLCASAVYIFNDICDIDLDRLHPKKKNRPIASGSISKRNALIYAVSLAIISFAVSYWIAPAFCAFVFAYMLVHVLYSMRLKGIAIIDIFCIASGFVLRVFAGGEAFNVAVSKWLFLAMFTISLVLAAGKRLSEAMLLREEAETHRKSLNIYSISTLNEILLISSSASLISYALYTIEQFNNLFYTIPIVSFGLFRYLLLSKQGMGDPTEALTKDRWLALTVSFWLLLVGLIRYYY